MNTRYIEAEFDYVKPASLDEALDILATRPHVKVYAGGTDLIVRLKSGAPVVMDTMMDINGIEELCTYSVSETAGARIGTAVKLSALEKNPMVMARWPSLCQAIAAMASISVRNMGSIGGNLCNASPGADTAGPLICYGASLEIAGKDGVRVIPVEKFFVGPGKVALREGELLTHIILPLPGAHTGSGFRKVSMVRADLAKLSISVVLQREQERIKNLRMAMGSMAATPLFLRDISAAAVGKTVTRALLDEIAEQVTAFVKPVDDPNRTSAEYRRDMTRVITRDTMAKAWERSGGSLK